MLALRRFARRTVDLWQLGLLLVALWAGLTGGEGWLFGAVAIGLALLASRRLAPMSRTRFSLPGLARFLGYFLASSLRGAFDVARRAFDPRLPLTIDGWEHHIALPPGQARTVFIATVSLLPGTLSRRLDGDRLTVHSIAGDLRGELGVLEARVRELFPSEAEAHLQASKGTASSARPPQGPPAR